MPHKNKEQQKQYSRRNYLAHREEVKARTKAWKLAHPEAHKVHGRTHYLRYQKELIAISAENRRLNKINKLHDERMRHPFPITVIYAKS